MKRTTSTLAQTEKILKQRQLRVVHSEKAIETVIAMCVENEFKISKRPGKPLMSKSGRPDAPGIGQIVLRSLRT